MRIVTGKLSKELREDIKRIAKTLDCGITVSCLDNFRDDTNIKYIKIDDELVAFCIYSNIDKDTLIGDLEEFYNYYDNETYEYYKQFIDEIKEGTIYIHYIESIKKGFGFGKEILNSIFDLKKNIILYSTADAEDFWVSNNFENIFGYEYMYTAN